jgi:PD-(D/E)XK nuclease superfamily protein
VSIFVSASSLQDFLACEQKVYYRIFEKGEAVPSREMLMGTITHKVLEKHWDDLDKAIDYALSLCKEYKLDKTAENSVEHFVRTYFYRFSSMVSKDDNIEKRFKVKMTGDVYLVGVFDRVTRGTVIDWKTSANPPKRIDNNVQFIIYDMAYKLLYKRPPEGLYLAALSNGSLVRYSESKEHADTLVTKIIPEFVEAVRTKSFIKTGLFNGSCYRCPYKVPCLGGEKSSELVRSEFTQE